MSNIRIKYQIAGNWFTSKLAVFVGYFAAKLLLLQAYLAAAFSPTPTIGFGGQVVPRTGLPNPTFVKYVDALDALTDLQDIEELEDKELCESLTGGPPRSDCFFEKPMEESLGEQVAPVLSKNNNEDSAPYTNTQLNDALDRLTAALQKFMAAAEAAPEPEQIIDPTSTSASDEEFLAYFQKREEDAVDESAARPPTKAEIDALFETCPLPHKRAKKTKKSKKKSKKAK